MRWSELKEIIDNKLIEAGIDDTDILYIDTGNHPDDMNVYITEGGLLVVQ